MKQIRPYETYTLERIVKSRKAWISLYRIQACSSRRLVDAAQRYSAGTLSGAKVVKIVFDNY